MLRSRVAFLAVLAACSTMVANPLAAQSRPPVPGQPYQYWDVLEADGGARKIYFRNDQETAQSHRGIYHCGRPVPPRDNY